MQPGQQAVVAVHFDLLPTSMRFNAPAYPCLVTENDIQYSNGFAETYDPRLDPDAVETSFEPAFDDFNTYARMWIDELIADPDYYGVASTIVNPAIGVRGWGKDPVELKIDEQLVKSSKQFRIGYEATGAGTNLVI